jgi:hypothetical protein
MRLAKLEASLAAGRPTLEELSLIADLLAFGLLGQIEVRIIAPTASVGMHQDSAQGNERFLLTVPGDAPGFNNTSRASSTASWSILWRGMLPKCRCRRSISATVPTERGTWLR